MTVRTLAAALLILPIAPAPSPPPALAVDDSAPVLKVHTELGGGDTSWAQQGVYAPDGKTLFAAAGGPNSGSVYVIDPVAGKKLATLKADPPTKLSRQHPSGF